MKKIHTLCFVFSVMVFAICSSISSAANVPPVPSPTCVQCPSGYHCGHNPERCIPNK